MPNIKGYDSPVDGLQPSNLGVEATAQAARRIGGEYNSAAEAVRQVGGAFARNLESSIKDVGQVAVDYMTHREISHGAPTEAQLTNNLTNLWNNTVSDTAKNDPNDPSVAAKFRETVLEPGLEEFRKGFDTEGGQKWAEARIDRLRNHFFEKTTADMSTLAGIAVKQNVHQLANVSSNTAMTDPSAVPHLLDTAESSVGAMVDSSPNLRGPVAAAARVQLIEQMKEGIVKAGAIGAIQKSADPDKTAQEWGAKYPKYINGAELKQLGAVAKAQQKSNLLTDKQLEMYQHQQMVRAAQTDYSKAFSENVSFDDTGKETIKPGFFKQIMDIERKYPGAATPEAKAMINWAQSQQREKRETIITDKATYSDLIGRTTDPTNPTSRTEILNAMANHKIDAHDGSVALQLQNAVEQQPIKSPMFHNSMSGVKAMLGNGELGQTNFAKFYETFVPLVQQLEREGKLSPADLSIKNKDSLLMKTFKDFELTGPQKMTDALMKRLGAGGDMAGFDPTKLLNPDAGKTPAVPKVTTKSEFDNLPSGSEYIGKDGKRYRKP